MEIRYKLYPYPVLAYYSDDYKDGSFDTTIDLQKDGYNIRIDFMASLTNEGLKKLIHDGQARYVYHLECAQTGFREVVTTEKVAESRMLSDKKICGKLQICPFIVATQDITGYSNPGFHDDYSGTTFEIEAGCVLLPRQAPGAHPALKAKGVPADQERGHSGSGAPALG